MISTAPQKSKMTLWKRIWRTLQRPLISGLVIVIPISITLFVLKLAYDFTAGHLEPIIKKIIEPNPLYLSPIIACIFLFILVYLVGLLASVVLGRKLIGFFEAAINKIPYIKFLYGTSKQIVQSLFTSKQNMKEKMPVLVEFPRPGMKCIGFTLGKVVFCDGREFYRVFIPTTPNITIGLLQFVAAKDVYQCELSFDDAVKMVVSGGILGGEHIKYIRVTHVSLDAESATEGRDEDETIEEM